MLESIYSMKYIYIGSLTTVCRYDACY